MAVAGFGVSGGMFPALVGVTWPRFYGLLHLGAISGFNMSIMVFGTAFGPYIFGASYEWTGSYSIGLKVCLVLPLLVLVAAFKADNPQETGK